MSINSKNRNTSQVNKFNNKNTNNSNADNITLLDKFFEAIKNLIYNFNGNSSSSDLNKESSIKINKEKFHDESMHPYAKIALRTIESFNQQTNIILVNSKEILDLTNLVNENPKKNTNKKNIAAKQENINLNSKTPSAAMKINNSSSQNKNNNLKNH